MNLAQDKTVLLFYKDYESDSFVPYDRYLKRVVKPILYKFNHKPRVTGFLVWCQLLIKALEQQGYTVHLNNYRLAKANPDYPVGVLGYPAVLDNWTLPNPAIIGPGLYDHPSINPNLMDDPRFHYYILTCQWMLDMFKPYYGDTCVLWYAGMDVQQWPDTSKFSKTNDVLIYDKIRWNRDVYEPDLLEPITNLLSDKGLSYKILRYGAYDHQMYHDHLVESRSMIFLCEHETQGMAYQEAMSANVPILAWENGYWLDPDRPAYDPNPIEATSVPYFAAECGEKFQGADDFQEKFVLFWSRLGTYTPRDYVNRELSFKKSAELYMQYYSALIPELAHT